MTAYFLSPGDRHEVVDKTYYSYGSELNWEEINSLVSFIKDVETLKNNYENGKPYSGYVPLVHMLNHGNICEDSMVRFFTIVSLVHLLHIFFLS